MSSLDDAIDQALEQLGTPSRRYRPRATRAPRTVRQKRVMRQVIPSDVEPSPDQAPEAAAPASAAPAIASPEEFQTVWNGTLGRQGKSLTTTLGMGSSLAPGPAFKVRVR
jgi:hypothetical protein